jgi:SAM-dependent methyltransferase
MLGLKFYERIETPTYRRGLSEYSKAALPLLEAGCGTGRFTGLFSELGSEVVAVDMSRDSILRNRVRHAGKTASPIHYVHADLTHLPLGSRYLAAWRTAVFTSISRRAPCGNSSSTMRVVRCSRAALCCFRLIVTAASPRLFGKEGEHAGGIPLRASPKANCAKKSSLTSRSTRFAPTWAFTCRWWWRAPKPR